MCPFKCSREVVWNEAIAGTYSLVQVRPVDGDPCREDKEARKSEGEKSLILEPLALSRLRYVDTRC